jgi:AcrR family transcriptional regulator
MEADGGWVALDRRRRRRQQTIDEILAIALDVMAEEGVGGMSLSAVARRLGIQPPSLYKYFPSKLALYDALFEHGSREYLAVFRSASGREAPGLAALRAGLDATGRWMLEHQVLAQLLFWRPVPGFEPSAEAFAPSVALVDDIRSLVEAAAQAGEVHPDAASEEGLAALSVLTGGMLSQQLANEPEASWETGRFTRLAPRLFEMFVLAYPPEGR